MGVSFEVYEESTVKVDFTFTDSNDDTFVPDTAYWQLTKASDGSIINNRSFANCSFSGTYIVLSGDDLAIDSAGDLDRILTIKGTYSSDYGSSLPFSFVKMFRIKNILAI